MSSQLPVPSTFCELSLFSCPNKASVPQHSSTHTHTNTHQSVTLNYIDFLQTCSSRISRRFFLPSSHTGSIGNLNVQSSICGYLRWASVSQGSAPLLNSTKVMLSDMTEIWEWYQSSHLTPRKRIKAFPKMLKQFNNLLEIAQQSSSIWLSWIWLTKEKGPDWCSRGPCCCKLCNESERVYDHRP